MANILDILNEIGTAIYGRDVRQAIIDAIRQCYEDGKAGVNDLQARTLIEAVMAVNEQQAAEIETLTARVEELEEGGSGGSSETSTTSVPTFLVESGTATFENVGANKTATQSIVFTKNFTEAPTVLAIKIFRQGANTFYSQVTAQPIQNSITTTGFTLAIGNKYTQAVSPSVLWVAFQPTTVEVETEITTIDGMSEADVRALLAPITAALDSLKIGYDGTEYDTPGASLRQQINALHVLIGDEPGTAISASAIAYGEDSDVETALDEVNGRLTQLSGKVLAKELALVAEKNVSATSGSTITKIMSRFSASVQSGETYVFELVAPAGSITKYTLYSGYNDTFVTVASNLLPNTQYEYTASSEIDAFHIYVGGSGVLSTGTITEKVSTVTVNEDSLQSQVECVSLDSAISMFSLSSTDLEDGAIRNGTGEDFSSPSRVRTKVYIPVKSGTVISSNFNFNVWEYEFPGKRYIRDGGQWLNSYTVVNDCYIRIMWSSASGGPAQLLAGTVISSLTKVDNALYDSVHVDYIEAVSKDIINASFATEIPLQTVKSIAHRGDDVEAPQCTAPAYIIARKRGFTVAENDLWLSEDGEFVMWHDTNLARLGNMVDINGYLMYTDGTDYYWVHPTTNTVYTWNGSDYVASSVALSGLDRCNGTYYGVNSQYSVTGLLLSVLKRIDFGVYKGTKFAGTQILTFAEWVLLCKQLGMEIYIDRKLTYTTELITQAANIVKRYGMGDYASWLGLNTSQITLLRSIIPDSRCGILQHPTAATAQSYQPYNIGRGFFFNGDAKNGMTAETIQTGLDAGFEVEVWFVDVTSLTEEQKYETIKTAVSYGVTGMTLDHYRVNDAFKSLIESY